MLFKENIFSVKHPTFSPLKDFDKTELSEIIKKHYPSLIITGIEKIGAFEINSNNWKIESGLESFILKKVDISKSEALSTQADWTSQLQTYAFPTLRFLKNKEERLISTEGNDVYCITYFEDGHYFGSSYDEWIDLLRNLKLLFDYSAKYKSSSSLIPSRIFFTSDEDQLIAQIKFFPEIKNITNTQLSLIIEEYKQLKQIFQAKKLKHSVFHIDIHPHNLIINNNKLILLTDFESFQVTTTEVSLGFGIYKCMRQLLTLENDPLRIKERILELKIQFETIFPGYDFIELLTLGKIDILKRLLFILKEILDKKEPKWLFMLGTQLDSLEEINKITKL
ncbi:MAG: hypothetical protein H0W84_02945 [Bacteroidetes bacterium]|nr:hypothetical protein [Bacteroidota bacterium]